MIVWISTDMEGLAGVDRWEQCYDPDDDSPAYLHGRDQLTADANAAIAGCFDAGATEVRILDGHGRNRNRGFTDDLDPRARAVWIDRTDPLRWEGLDETVHAAAVVGQHAMAGTLHGFIDHTQVPKEIVHVRVNGQAIGELSQMAIHAGGYGVPLAHASGDEALCAEARRLLSHAAVTPTKRGTGWETCDLYPVDRVREEIRRDIAAALRAASRGDAVRVSPPIEVEVEWAWSAPADRLARVPGVRRIDARTVGWILRDPRDIHSWPGEGWHPGG